MTAFFLSTEASFLAVNFRYTMYTYMFPWYNELSMLLKCITCPSSLSDIELSNIDTVREILKSLRSVQISILKPKKYPRSSKNISVL